MKKNKAIVTYPDKKLRYECESVQQVDQELLDLVSKLKKSLLAAENGVGLSAPQVGAKKRVFAIADHDHVHVYINPQIVSHEKDKSYPQLITEAGDRQDFFEGCLSFPDVYGTVKRWLEIKVKYQVINEDNELAEKEEELPGFMAIVFQHELDHLNGVLFIDRIRQEDGQVYKDTGDELEEIDLEQLKK